MNTPVVVLGAGGHAKVVLEILEETGHWDIVGCTSARGPSGALLNYPVLGSDEVLSALYRGGVRHAFVAIGDNRLRQHAIRRARELGFELINAVSRRAALSSRVKMGSGIAIMASAAVNVDSILGDGVIVNTGASVDHDCLIGAYAHIGPGVRLAGGVEVGEGAFLGVGSCVIPGIRIGSWAIVGAGAAVVKDVAAGATVVGVPARVLRTNERTEES